MKQITSDLYQFTTHIKPIDFSINQYLLASNPAILFATGTKIMALDNLPKIKQILKDQPLKYLFISHLESDECGGLSIFKEEYPDLQIICSNLASRELPGYGFCDNLMPVYGGFELEDGNLCLQIIDYPSEVHLQNGIICFESNRKIIYSSDLMQEKRISKVINGNWQQEVAAIDDKRVCNQDLLNKLKTELAKLEPEFVATGHGSCIKCQS